MVQFFRRPGFSQAWKRDQPEDGGQEDGDQEDGDQVEEAQLARSSVKDLPTGPKTPHATVLSLEDEAIILAF